MEQLRCLNCEQEVSQEDAQIFAGVFCCPKCFFNAQRMDERMSKELDQLKLLGREAIRVALTTGKLHFGEQKLEDMSKVDLMRAIVSLQEAAETRQAKTVPFLAKVSGSKYTR